MRHSCMNIDSITLELTASCNYNCCYCYQYRTNEKIHRDDLKKALDFFVPHLNEGGYINFFGGEPLLEFNNIKWAHTYLEKKRDNPPKKIRFSTSTNGSLITPDMLELFSKYKYEVLLSFDGLAQEQERHPDSYQTIKDVITKTLKFPEIQLETNSVFTSRTIHQASDSLKNIADLGVRDIDYSLNSMETWTDTQLDSYEAEMEKILEWMAEYYDRTKHIPIGSFREEDSDKQSELFKCYAAVDRIAVAPDLTVWGCPRIADHFLGKPEKPDYDKYSLGILEDFINNHIEILNEKTPVHEHLRMDHFWTEKKLCAQCGEVNDCSECPFSAQYVHSIIGKIPSWKCRIRKIEKSAKRRFQQMIKYRVS